MESDRPSRGELPDYGSAYDDFDEEIVRTRRNERLMVLLDERGKQTKTVPLETVQQQLGLR